MTRTSAGSAAGSAPPTWPAAPSAALVPLQDVQPYPPAGELLQLRAELLSRRVAPDSFGFYRTEEAPRHAGPGGADGDVYPVRGQVDLHCGEPDRPLEALLHRTADRAVLRGGHDHPAGHGVLLAGLGHPGPDLPLNALSSVTPDPCGGATPHPGRLSQR